MEFIVNDMVIVKGVANILIFLVRHISIAIFIGDIASIMSYSFIIMFVCRKGKPSVSSPTKEQQGKTFMLPEAQFLYSFLVLPLLS